MPAQEILPFLAGFFGILAIRLILYAVARRIPIVRVAVAKTTNARGFALLVLNLAIVATGISISVYAIIIAVGGNTMTPDELHQLIASAQSLLNWAWAIYGAVAAAVIIFIIEFASTFISRRRDEERNREVSKIAYQLYEQEGLPNGRDKEHWAKAEAIWDELHKRKHKTE